jgi:hypothetical protein
MNERLIALTKNPNFEQLCDDVWVIHDFTTVDERNFYIALAENALEDEWWQREPGWWNGKFLASAKRFECSLSNCRKNKKCNRRPRPMDMG